MKHIMLRALLLGTVSAVAFLSVQSPVLCDLRQEDGIETRAVLRVAPQVANPKIVGLAVCDVQKYADASNRAYAYGKGIEVDPTRVHQFNTARELSGFVEEHEDGSITVSYKGTTSLRNVFTDLWCNFAFHANGGRYHNGIMEGYKATRAQVVDILSGIAARKGIMLRDLADQITFTGHSLGGGLATIAADDFRRTHGMVTRLVTFAAPRVMDDVCAEEFNAQMRGRALTVVQEADPVPVAMFGTFGAKHVGDKLYLPYHTGTTLHKLLGYRLALEALAQTGRIQTPKKVYAFELSEADGVAGIGGSLWIKDTYAPNPFGLLNKGSKWVSTNIVRPAHYGAKIVKYTLCDAVSKVASSVKSALVTAKEAILSTKDSVVSAAKSTAKWVSSWF